MYCVGLVSIFEAWLNMCICAKHQWKSWSSLSVSWLFLFKLSNFFDTVLQTLQQNAAVMSCAVKRLLCISQSFNGSVLL